MLKGLGAATAVEPFFCFMMFQCIWGFGVVLEGFCRFLRMEVHCLGSGIGDEASSDGALCGGYDSVQGSVLSRHWCLGVDHIKEPDKQNQEEDYSTRFPELQELKPTFFEAKLWINILPLFTLANEEASR